jgi:hypothetical protein
VVMEFVSLALASKDLVEVGELGILAAAKAHVATAKPQTEVFLQERIR